MDRMGRIFTPIPAFPHQGGRGVLVFLGMSFDRLRRNGGGTDGMGRIFTGFIVSFDRLRGNGGSDRLFDWLRASGDAVG